MKKVITRTRIILLVNILLVSVTHIFGQTTGTENEIFIAGDATIDSVFEASLPEIEWTQDALARNIPSSVDNSILSEGYMPPIFNQCQTGSCVQCSEIAYTFTYEMNRFRGARAGTSWTGTEEQRENLYHPFFTYNFLNYGNGGGNSGTYFGSGFKIVFENGCPSLNDYYDPILNQYFNPGSSEESHDAVRRWMDGNEKYIAASENRILKNGSFNGSFKISWSNTYSSLNDLKRWLSNHNSTSEIGGLAVISVYMGNGYSTARIPEGSPHANEYMLTTWAPSGGHAMTIVGYDDAVCCFDYNENGIYDEPSDNTPLEQCEKGAFKVANSWGTTWKNQGYVWIPYSLMLGVMGHDYRAYTCMATSAPEKSVFLSATVKHPKRDKIILYVGRGGDASLSAPEDSSYYNMFNRSVTNPGALPMNGFLRNPQPIRLSLNFGEKYSPYNCGKYFFKVNDNYYGNYTNGTAYVDNLQLRDYRWGEVFVLDAAQSYATIQSNSITTMSVDYDLIYPFSIEQNYTCATNKVARRTVTVSGQSSLTINDGVNLDMYGTEAYDCKLLIEPNSKLIIGNNAVITAKRGNCEIEVKGDVQIGHGVQFKAENGATLKIIIDGQQSVTIDGCFFTNAMLEANARTSNTMSSTNASSFSISNCSFNARIGQCAYALRVEGYSNIMIADNTVNGIGIMSSQHYTDGFLLYNCGTAGIGSQILRNTINGCTGTGLTLYGTAADIKGKNEITQCHTGVKLLNGSTVNNFTSNCTALNASQTQHIHNNDYCELFIYRDCMPQTFRYNCITSSGSGWFVEYENNVEDDKGLCIRLDLEYNNWGDYANTQIESRFNYITNTNNGVVFDFLPKWEYNECLSNIGVEAQRASAEADSLWGIGLYASAKTSYKEIVMLYPNTNSALNAMKKLLLIEGNDGTDYAGLQQYYLSDSTVQGHEDLSVLASSLANKCDELLEHYDKAIAWYEAIIEDEETPYNDSVFASIDLGNLYLRMEANGAKGVKGKLAQFVPKSAEAFAKQTDEALRKLRHTPRRLNPSRELPDQYWTDIVTEQPEGYVVDENGDVKIYSAEALAWLCSVTNGLNGQEIDDFQGKTISLESNVDMSEALWVPISGSNSAPAFKGIFNGKEHIIDGLQLIKTNLYNYTGFIGKLAMTSLSNVVLRNGYFEGTGYRMGFLASIADNCVIDHCFVECEMHGGNIAPFIYESRGSLISNSLVYSPLLKSHENGFVHGAFVGNNRMGNDNTLPEIINCASIIEKMEWSELCGFVGEFNHGLIANCYAYIGEALNFPGYGGGLGPRNGITKDNMGEIYNCYFNRIRNYSSSSNYYLELDDMPTSDNSGIIQDAIPFAEEDRGHWKLTEAITFDLESGTVSTDDLLDALNLKVQLLDEENLLNWCDSGMGFNNLQLPVFCDFDVTEISENRTNNDQVLLYPNPANGLVRISGMEVAEVQIYNTLGQLLKTCRNTNEISVSDAPAGLYLLRITDENGATATGKVVVK